MRASAESEDARAARAHLKAEAKLLAASMKKVPTAEHIDEDDSNKAGMLSATDKARAMLKALDNSSRTDGSADDAAPAVLEAAMSLLKTNMVDVSEQLRLIKSRNVND